MRNSLLVERFCAENPTGLKVITEDVGGILFRQSIAVGERCESIEVRPTRFTDGATTSENVGISNFIDVKTINVEHPRFPIPWQSGSG